MKPNVSPVQTPPNGQDVVSPAYVLPSTAPVPSNGTGVAPTPSVTQKASTAPSKAAAATPTAPTRTPNVHDADEPGDADQESSIDNLDSDQDSSIDDAYDVADDLGSLSDDWEDPGDDGAPPNATPALPPAHVLEGDQYASISDPTAPDEDESSIELTQDDAISAAESATSSQSATNFRLTDLGNAKRLVNMEGNDIHYCYGSKKWLVWDGSRWAQDNTGEIYRRAKHVIQSMLRAAACIADDKERKAVIAHEQRSESHLRLNAMVKLAESEKGVPIQLSELDQDLMLFNCQNRTLDLRTGRPHEHCRSDLTTKIAPVEYDPNAKCPLWLEFLNKITNGDVGLQRYLQRAVGYSFTGNTNEHCLFLLYGIGANGKSTFLEVIRHVLGDYAQTADFNSLMVSKGEPIRNDIARLKGARFVTATESEDGKRMAESLVKQLTGGDTVAARFLYNEHFEFIPQFKLWLGTNHKPTIRGTDEGIWRRIRFIPFTVSIPRNQQDRDLPMKLKSEASGILNWALAGFADYQVGGLQEPTVVEDATKEYRADQDIIAHFIDARCVVGKGLTSPGRALYSAYKKWADESGEYVMNERVFSQALSGRGLEKQRTGSGMVWKGINVADVTVWGHSDVDSIEELQRFFAPD